jgi:hypothetical protein
LEALELASVSDVEMAAMRVGPDPGFERTGAGAMAVVLLEAIQDTVGDKIVPERDVESVNNADELIG